MDPSECADRAVNTFFTPRRCLPQEIRESENGQDGLDAEAIEVLHVPLKGQRYYMMRGLLSRQAFAFFRKTLGFL
jgi:hypothetical protein